MQNENFFLAVLLSVGVLVGFHYLYEKPQMEKYRQQQLALQHEQAAKGASASQSSSASGTAGLGAPAAASAPEPVARAQLIAQGHRVRIQTAELHGSINLQGGRLDDLELAKYRQSVDPNAADVVLFAPAGSAPPDQAYYAAFGWLGEGVALPGQDALWTAQGDVLTPDKPVKLTWNNGHGLVFERTFMVDEHFMFTIADRVRNESATTATLFPYGLIARHGKPLTHDIYYMHEGPIAALDGTLKEYKYKDLVKDLRKTEDSKGGWIGITDKYWLVALVPDQGERITASYVYEPSVLAAHPEAGVFQGDFRGSPVSLAPGASVERTTRLFAGAKRLQLLGQYEDRYDIPLFDHAIDFGWYPFLTKPFLYLLDFLGGIFGNFGLAIVAFTLLLKLMTLPLSMKSYRSQARMKALQPEIKAIQERYPDDKQRQGLETMELYKREKVNPLSGCLPMLIQIPIFFALYKVLYIGIDLRQAPLFGWIKDMSEPDPTSVLTLFGALPSWGVIPHLGVWPVLMGLSMFAQQRLSPQPPDKTQAQIFMALPVIFTFMLSKVAVGLIFYWTLSNLIGLAQQWFIMHKLGHRRS